ncbi:RNA-binding protein 48-like [Haliotis asinina]|uniref:RNA-binding protein 48-like n=1 Tax=Haliotis asinina TaxID=109174 RepID=UPI0035323CB9
MSAPTIPKHHIRKEVCVTRPAYREGRLEKAVKVYTVNQESKYLLVQGVPAVGGCAELVKLFAVYGAIEEYRILDDYPAEEFTEVYLFKFKKIQSARFAKKKLDDYSFFGGVLHVCYAPEFESVDETREKLQDRRKVIAAKLRQHGLRTDPVSERTNTEDDKLHNETSILPSTSQSYHRGTSLVNNQRVPSIHPTSTEHSIHQTSIVSHANSVNRSQSANESEGLESSEHQGGDNSVALHKLWLPPPPVDRGPPRFRPSSHNRYEYAWVQSSHATLPSNYDGRTVESESLAWSHDPGVQGQRNDQNMDKFDQQTKDSNKNSKEEKVDKPKPGEKVVNGLIVREYKKAGKVPKFVPRQALKKTGVSDGESPKPRTENDALNKQIRVNAFTLADTQGPTMPGKGDQTVKVHPGAQKAVNQTVKDIRKRISKFIAEKVPQQKKVKES